MLPTPLLIAHLHHLPRTADGFLQALAFCDGVADGLLDIHILAGLDRVQRHGNVPVVRRADDHGIHVLAVEHRTVIDIVRAGRGRKFSLRRQTARFIHVAERHDLGPRFARQAQQIGTAAPGAQSSDAHAFIGAQDSAGRQRSQDGGVAEEVAAVVVHG